MAIWYCASDKWTAVTAWAALTTYVVGDLRRQLAAPAVGVERVFRVSAITTGISGAAEPTWTTTKGGSTTDSGVTWTEVTGDAAYNATNTFAAPHASLASLVAWMAAGDIGYVGNHHAATRAAANTVTVPGTLAAPCYIYCVDDTNATPTITTGATDSSTGNFNYTITGHHEMYGISFRIGSGSSNNQQFTLAGTAGNRQTYEQCEFQILTTGNSSLVQFGATGTQNPSAIDMVGVGFKFGATGQMFDFGNGLYAFRGGSILSGGTGPTTGLVEFNIGSGGRGAYVTFDGFDMVNGGNNMVLARAALAGGKVIFNNCKLPTTWSSGTLTSAVPVVGFRAEMYNCDTTDTNYRLWIEDYCGSIKSETTIVVTGGSSDGTTPFSFVMATSANAEYPGHVLRAPSIFKRQETTGAGVTATVECIHSGIGGGTAGSLLDTEGWLEVQALTTSGFPLGGWISDRAVPLVAAADQGAGGATWTSSPGTPVKNKFVTASFTPQEKGDVIGTVCQAKASVTVYYNVDLDGIGASTKAVYITPGIGFRAETAGTSGGGLAANPLRGFVL